MVIESQPYKAKFLCGNDDSIYKVRVPELDDVDYVYVEFEDADRVICEGLGIEVHPDKSFSSKHSVFFEEYSHG